MTEVKLLRIEKRHKIWQQRGIKQGSISELGTYGNSKLGASAPVWATQHTAEKKRGRNPD